MDFEPKEAPAETAWLESSCDAKVNEHPDLFNLSVKSADLFTAKRLLVSAKFWDSDSGDICHKMNKWKWNASVIQNYDVKTASVCVLTIIIKITAI